MGVPLLDIQNLSIDFKTEEAVNHALKNVSFQVNKGEILAIVGESGSGKSITSLSILRLLHVPPANYTSGKIFFSEDGKEALNIMALSQQQLLKIRGNAVSMIFQEPMSSLNPVYTCGQQVVETLRLHKRISAKQAKQEAIEWFRKVKLPDPESVYYRYPHEISGGQKQRVMIAMAMCCKPSLLICDEPTTALDVTVQKTVLALIKELQQETNMGVIFITHDLGVVAEIADRGLVMYKGEVVESNTIQNLFLHPSHAYTQALIACRPINHRRGERLPVIADFLKPNDDSHVLKKDSCNHTERIPKDLLVKVEELNVWFPKKRNWLGNPVGYIKAVNNVSFEIYQNETLGLVGESGCGKTTLGRSLLQLIPATSGNIYYKDKSLAWMKKEALRNLRKYLQIIFQDPYSSLNPRKKIGDAIAEPLYVHEPKFNAKDRKEQVVAILEKVGLQADHYYRYPHEFSGGQRQRIVIARALVLRPSFVICDESVSALDVSVQAQVLNLLNDLKKEFGFTIVFISHDLSVVKYFSDRIIVMNKGRIEESGSADDIYMNPQTEYTKTLIDSIPKGIVEEI